MKMICAVAVIATIWMIGPVSAFDDGPFAQTSPHGSSPPSNLVNPRNGEVAVPTGPKYTNTRDGTVYAPAGANGVIDTRTGSLFLHRDILAQKL